MDESYEVKNLRSSVTNKIKESLKWRRGQGWRKLAENFSMINTIMGTSRELFTVKAKRTIFFTFFFEPK